jgi:DNA-binding transcriptional MocR family regulator
MTSGTELSSLLGPVRSGNAFEETVERLLTVIKLGVVAPRERFPAERELAGLLGVSRITLREAIRALQQAGYVESRRGRFGGTFVTYTRRIRGRRGGSRWPIPPSSPTRSRSGWRWRPAPPRSWPPPTATGDAMSCSSG